MTTVLKLHELQGDVKIEKKKKNERKSRKMKMLREEKSRQRPG